ncbi:TrkH family potassium uptake protein [Lactonifactor longoviformis]|uniref:TrkH family potassium uptake protein n=1 Tax=Lactonifactor longoviformis TaxID=341220 RepID=UPI00210A9BC7|nr:TrkH family potassium uptake protein [Lactonifactor longoviformis]MCQ4671431.1 TrkH family potassium uptake protein [Lactonifactor longoviformis]
MIQLLSKKFTTTKLIVLGYLVVILTGTFLLMVPISSKESGGAGFIDSLFTATSATCVTGLVLHDTFTYWSGFGQAVILLLIQIGGIGFMTIAITALTFTKKKIGLSQRLIMQEAVVAPQVGGIVRMTKFILCGAMLFEGIGAIFLAFWFVPRLGIGKGIYFSVFHSISAFCNAGIDLMGQFEKSSSLVTAGNSPVVCLTITALIIVGGLGFFVWSDIRQHGRHFKNYKLHTKMVISMTTFLIVSGTLLLLLFEFHGQAMAGKSVGEKVMAAFFQSVTPRTAGFNTIPLDKLNQTSQLTIIALMFIGGSPGSTAGGIKTTTAMVLMLSIWTELFKRKDIECFKRRIDGEILRHATCIMMLYVMLIMGATVAIAAIDQSPIEETLFEVTSAIGTVGLSLGITADLSTISHLILVLLMFVGRVGGITILISFGNRIAFRPSKLPQEKVTVG